MFLVNFKNFVNREIISHPLSTVNNARNAKISFFHFFHTNWRLTAKELLIILFVWETVKKQKVKSFYFFTKKSFLEREWILESWTVLDEKLFSTND